MGLPQNKHDSKSSIPVISLERGVQIPQAIDLEEAVIGAMMIDTKCVDEVLLVIKQADVFFKSEHVLIFEAIQLLHLRNEPIDLLTVSAQLRSTGGLNDAGGDFYLIQLTQKISSGAHSEFHSRILLQKWIKRQMIRDSSENLSAAYDDEIDVFDLLGKASEKLDNIISQTHSGGADMTMKEAMSSIKKRVEFLSFKDEHDISGVLTGFKKVDLITGGWQDSDLIIIAARPGMGKTSFVMRGLLENVKRKVPIGFISCEMSTQQLVTRMVACNSHFHLKQLFRTGFEKQKYFEQFIHLENEMAKFPAYFDDHSKDLIDVVAKVRLWHRKYGIKKVIIDYLQLMSYSGLKKTGNREQEISTITRTLKGLAKELNIPIILLSQLSRELEKRGNKRPVLSDLRESGAIEQDADVVGFIYRPSYYGLEPDEDMIAMGANTEFIIAKHRNGSLDRKGLYFDENKTKFMDPEDYEATVAADNEMIAAADKLPTVAPGAAFDTADDKQDDNESDFPF